MTVSAAKLEANRRNSQKSTGPRTEAGKIASSQNAVTHGLRAKTLVLLGEDPLVLDDRRAAWRACLAPRDEVELSVVDDAVVYSWMQDRARRAQAARLATNIANAGIDQAKREEDEVLLLGRQPMEAVDDRNVLLIFIACQRMEGQPIDAIPEIWNELRIDETTRYAERLRGRGIDRLAPADAVAARQVLFDVIDRATAQIKVKAKEHRRRAEIVEPLAAECLLFDDSPEGERLRRYDLANGRGKARALNELRLRQRSPLPNKEGLKNEDGGPRKFAEAHEIATSQPTDAPANVTNEATAPSEIAPNEPTDVPENVTNEATAPSEIAPNEPTDVPENVTNEATAPSGIAPNEPTGVPGNVTNEATAPSRMHELVEQAEDRRKEAERLMAHRRARRRDQRQKNRKSEDHSKGRVASGGPLARLPVG